MNLLNYVSKAALKPGTYKAVVKGYEEVNEKVTNSFTSKAYVNVILEAGDTVQNDKWFEGRIPWVMKDLKAQFGLQYNTISLERLLQHMMKNEFQIIVTEDSEYGTQINYTTTKA